MRSHSPGPEPGPDREAALQRRGQLALALQEIFTATARLRSSRQVAADAESFRGHIKHLLGGAEREARRLGYAPEDVSLALYAVVAFLDESVLNSNQPMFAGWPSRPLQEEIFGGHMGGEVFFQYLRQLLARADSEDTADVLEVYQLCLLLGFQGRYSTGDRGERRELAGAVAEKLRRVRGGFGELAPGWAPTEEAVARARDPWILPLTLGAVFSLVLALALFALFRWWLATGIGVAPA